MVRYTFEIVLSEWIDAKAINLLGIHRLLLFLHVCSYCLLLLLVQLIIICVLIISSNRETYSRFVMPILNSSFLDWFLPSLQEMLSFVSVSIHIFYHYLWSEVKLNVSFIDVQNQVKKKYLTLIKYPNKRCGVPNPFEGWLNANVHAFIRNCCV